MSFTDIIQEIIDLINDIVWGPVMIAFLLGTGLLFTVRTGFLQITKFKAMLNETIIKAFRRKSAKADKGGISPFQALSTALAGTIGTGNIAGVATAITIAGPGAIFWMVVAAFFGMMTKYAEVVLAISYRKKNNKGEWLGGPMLFIERGLNMRWLAYIYSILGVIASFGGGNIAQSNSVASAMKDAFNIPPLVTGILLALVVGITISGGLKKIASVTEIVVPFMSVFYILGAFAVIAFNITQLPAAFGLILKSAFNPVSPIGGFTGATVAMAIEKGTSRGIFTNEAGLGSASIAHASANTDSPARQGLWGMFEVFFDTVIMCTITALAIIVSGVWTNGQTGSSLTISAFESVLPSIGKYIIAVSLAFFAFSSILAWSYYGKRCLEYLSGEKNLKIYFFFYLLAIVLGATSGLNIVWELSDALNGLMAIPNLIGLLGLCTIVIDITRNNRNKLM